MNTAAKRVFAFVFALIIVFSFTSCTENEPVEVEAKPVTAEERAYLTERLEYYGYGKDSVQTDLLYDLNENASFLLAATDRGYVIYARNPLKFCECGDGNPYEEYMQYKKYYEGSVRYYAELPDGYYSILKQTYVEKKIP